MTKNKKIYYATLLVIFAFIIGAYKTGGILVLNSLTSSSLENYVVKQINPDKNKNTKKHYIPIIPITGKIDNESAKLPLALIEQINKDIESGIKIKEVILYINSPGGSVGASDALYTEIKNLKKHNIKISAFLDEVAASGGYYIACSADEITISPTCITGSIGVIIQSPNIKRGLDKIGIHMQTFKSGKYKDMLSMTKDIPLEEKEYIQLIVDTSYDKFLNIVKESRFKESPLPLEYLDGRIFLTDIALEKGFADKKMHFPEFKRSFDTKSKLVEYNFNKKGILGTIGVDTLINTNLLKNTVSNQILESGKPYYLKQ